MELHKVERGGVDWIDLTQNRDRWQALVSVVMNLRELQTILELVSFSRRTPLHEVNKSVFMNGDRLIPTESASTLL
jgi:hypothetical protein